MKYVIFLLIFFCAPAFSQADYIYTLCFTPAQQCTPVIVDAINHAQHFILVQAYSFTSVPILDALTKAHGRGVDVRVILDKGQVSKKGKYMSSTFLEHAGIPVWIDDKVAIAHNKVMIFDGASVLTGSFNFTKAAEKHNAENLIIITDAKLAKEYTANWESREAVSRKLN